MQQCMYLLASVQRQTKHVHALTNGSVSGHFRSLGRAQLDQHLPSGTHLASPQTSSPFSYLTVL